MDTTETFIKMSDCPEIQELADDYWDRFSIGCWYSSNHVQCKGHFEDWHAAYKYCPVCAKELSITPLYSVTLRFEGDDNIWLPRQDQLQGMVVDGYEACGLLFNFYHWFEDNKHDFITPYLDYSMEQLWLAFVMKEKYNKVWNGEEWIDA